MSKQVSMTLPQPLSVGFARDLSLIMTGYDESTLSGQFAIARMLEATWASKEPLTLVAFCHLFLDSGLPDAQKLQESSSVCGDDVEAYNEALRTITQFVGQLTQSADNIDSFKDSVSMKWVASLMQLAASSEPIASKMISLMAEYDAASAELVPTQETAFTSAVAPGCLSGSSTTSVEAEPVVRKVVLMPEGMKPEEFIEQCLQSNTPNVVRTDAMGNAVMQVYKQADAVSVVQRMPPKTGQGTEGNAQQRRLLEEMADNCGTRKLVEVPEGNPLAPLYRDFPHFAEVLDMVSESLALAGCGDEGKPVRIPPMLLRGQPGTGKTYFAQELARVLKLQFVERDLSVTTEAFVISGMDSGWKNSKPGIVFDSLVNGKTGNPLILLNEVDKAATTGAHNSPLAALYSLLEPTSSGHFVDEFMPVSLDASSVIWVLTANDGHIPGPVLSRLETFDIRLPNEDECRVIAASVWTNLLTRGMPRGNGFCAELGEPMLDHMCKLSPRVMRKALTRAAGCAVQEGRKYLRVEDIERNKARYNSEEKRSIGFMQ